MKKLIVYDLDGTLIDTRLDLVQAINTMLKEMSAPVVAAEEICRFVGGGLDPLIQNTLKTQDPERLQQGERLFHDYYEKHLLDKTELYPGAREVLERFKDRRQAMITNKPDPFTRQILEGLGVSGYFCEVIAGDAEFPRKPDPRGLKAIMARCGIAARETVSVGDSPVDIQLGRAAGVFTVVITHGFGLSDEIALAKPDAIISRLDELIRLIE